MFSINQINIDIDILVSVFSSCTNYYPEFSMKFQLPISASKEINSKMLK